MNRLIIVPIFILSCISITGSNNMEYNKDEGGRLNPFGDILITPKRYPIRIGTPNEHLIIEVLSAVHWWNVEINKHYNKRKINFIQFSKYPDINVYDIRNIPNYPYKGRYYYNYNKSGNITRSHIVIMNTYWQKYPCILRHEIGHAFGLAHDSEKQRNSSMTKLCRNDQILTKYDANLIIKDYLKGIE